MNTFFLLANTVESKSHSFLDALPHMTGMLVVMITLAVLWGVCAFTAKMVEIACPDKTSVKPLTAPVASPEPIARTSASAGVPDDSRITPEIVAVIAAAVATATRNQAVRIVSIKPMSTSWERAGRQSVLTSHRIR